MSIPRLVAALTPSVSEAAASAGGRLKHRGFLMVALMLDQADVFPDNWIYVHDETVRVGRIQNFKNWSPEMVPDPRWTCLGLEYFCDAGDELWRRDDADLVAMASRELGQLGLADPRLVRDAAVVRVEEAYPVYDEGYLECVETLKRELGRLDNLQLVGRNGMHRYNNQDHSMLTAMLAVANVAGARHDLWRVNADAEYHEQGASAGAEAELSAIASTQPLVPKLNAREG
jgi:protoporphyrinogen oxidase